MISSTVARRYSGSTVIDGLLARAISARKVLLARIVEWRNRASGRRQLMRLTERDLRDIGISRTQARAEASKPFWEA
jgi:uncharacterized protein YjiS (DUF1127 family)